METPNTRKWGLFRFDRTQNAVFCDKYLYPPDQIPLDIQRAINGSNVLTTGTLFISQKTEQRCAINDWTVTTLARESSGVIIYRPGDISVYCDPKPPKGTATKPADAGPPDKPKAPTLEDEAFLYAVLPVEADWIQLTGFIGDLNDPARKSPGPIASADSYCWTPQYETKYAPTGQTNTTIKPCDLKEGTNAVRTGFYQSGWLYNRVTAPGVWAGTFSLSPVVVAGKSQSLAEDILFSGWSKEGVGWLGLNAQFEKSSTAAGNLNSLTGALAYKMRLSGRTTQWWGSPADGAYVQKGKTFGLGLRPGEVLVTSGQEYAVTRPTLNQMRQPKDLNIVEGVSYRQPISMTWRSYPSLLTLFPTYGVEGGWHIIRYLPVNDHFFRQVAGADASLRWPYRVAPNFTSTKAATIDFSFRERLLSDAEPYTNLSGASPSVQLTKRGRQYMRIALNWPLSSFLAITTSVQHGGLPPDFDAVSWTFTLGLSFSSTGTAEH